MSGVRTVILDLLVLAFVVASCGKIETYQPVAGTGMTKTCNVKMTDTVFEPATFKVPPGRAITVIVKNEGKARHTFVVNGLEGVGDVRLDLEPGKSGSFVFTGTDSTEYEYYSDLPGDEEAGLEGKMIVWLLHYTGWEEETACR